MLTRIPSSRDVHKADTKNNKIKKDKLCASPPPIRQTVIVWSDGGGVSSGVHTHAV